MGTFLSWFLLSLFGYLWLGYLMLCTESWQVIGLLSLIDSNRLPCENALLCALNPLVVVEVMGNLYLEGGILFLLPWPSFCLKKTAGCWT